MKKIILCLVSLALGLSSFLATAQNGPEVHPDGTVTFRYSNPTASQVQVDVQFAGRHDMVRGDDGVWTLTLGPAAKDIYPYCFVVDGNSVMDPENPDFFPNETFKNSLLDLSGGDPSTIYGLRDVPHGTVDYIRYPSRGFGNAIVYTPPFYDQNPDRHYPVMYLISGTTDTEEVYYKVGKMNLILDNLIAEGAAREMIIVLPYGNPVKAWPAGTNPFAMGDLFGDDVLNGLMPYVESHYRTINDREHRAVGGFSRGGNQGLALGLTNLDKFSWLCSYSSFTSTMLPGVYDDAAKLNEDINLFWLGVGTDDFLFGNAKEYMDFLDAKGIRNRKVFTTDKFGHTWMNARYFLDKSFRLLFQDDPYGIEDDALHEVPQPKPAPAAKKKAAPKNEQRLTPEVMARLFPRGVVSPEYGNGNPGGITFRFRDANAKNVELVFDDAPLPMTKDHDNVWSAYVVAQPGIYTYCFNVDGTLLADPNNMFLAPGRKFKYSIAEVKGGLTDMSDVPHGKVSYRYINDKPVCIYTPDGYTREENLPVIKLLCPAPDTYESWFRLGCADIIMDNLLGARLAGRTVLVMTEGNVPGLDDFIEDNYGKIVCEDAFACEHTWAESRDHLQSLLTGRSFNDAKPLSSNVNRNGYPRLLPDNSVIFKFNGPQDICPWIDLCGTIYPMTHYPDGSWMARTEPQVPGFHYYSLMLNGTSVADPASESYYGCGRMSSAIEIPEEGCELFEPQDVPHGQLREMQYWSEYTKSWRPVIVYTPASYEKGHKKYPVVYIHHGGGEDHRGWAVQGRIANILDNLVAEGKAKEMIVVCVNSNVPAAPGISRGYSWDGMQPYRKELVENIIPFVENTFRVQKGPHSRAMCGLSMGGGQSFYIGLRSPEIFANVGVFSTGMFGGISEAKGLDLDAEIPGMLSNSNLFNSRLDCFFMSCGEQDPRIDPTRNTIDKMRENGVDVKFNSYPGDHEWQVWRKSFAEFAQLIFK